MRALVTGGAGLIGSEIVDRLLESGHEVVSIDNYVAGKRENNLEASNNPNFKSVEADFTDEAVLSEILREGIDCIFHQAVSKNTVCLLDPYRDLEVNAGGTLKLLIAARRFGVTRFIHASTGSVYGPAEKFPTTEEHPKNPVSFYGNSKLAAENYVKLFNEFYGLKTTILRYFHVYGARQDSSDAGGVVSIFIRNALENKPLSVTGDGSQLRAFTHVSDIARINILAAQSQVAIGQIYNCASDTRVTIRQLAENVLSIAGRPFSNIHYVKPRIGDIYKFDIDNQKLKKQLKFEFQTNFQDGLNLTYRDLKKITNRSNQF
jgi:UDP-glucose 4-epimerase